MEDLYKRVFHVSCAALAGVGLAYTLIYGPRIVDNITSFPRRVVESGLKPFIDGVKGIADIVDKIPTSQPSADNHEEKRGNWKIIEDSWEKV